MEDMPRRSQHDHTARKQVKSGNRMSFSRATHREDPPSTRGGVRTPTIVGQHCGRLLHCGQSLTPVVRLHKERILAAEARGNAVARLYGRGSKRQSGRWPVSALAQGLCRCGCLVTAGVYTVPVYERSRKFGAFSQRVVGGVECVCNARRGKGGQGYDAVVYGTTGV